MKIEFERGMSDAKRWFRHSGLCLRNLNGTNVASSKPLSPDRRTDDQLAFRQAVKEAGRTWKTMAAEDREAWNAYARRHGKLISDQLYKDLSGWEVFLAAFIGRTLTGGGAPVRPDDAPPPAAVAAIEEVPSAQPDTFSFRITHGVVPEGHALVVRITPATASRGRRPYARTARMIRGFGHDSTLPLPPGGGVVTFEGARFSVAPGRRYGVAMRIVRLSDGMVSREFFADLYRAEPPAASPQDGDLPSATGSQSFHLSPEHQGPDLHADKPLRPHRRLARRKPQSVGSQAAPSAGAPDACSLPDPPRTGRYRVECVNRTIMNRGANGTGDDGGRVLGSDRRVSGRGRRSSVPSAKTLILWPRTHHRVRGHAGEAHGEGLVAGASGCQSDHPGLCLG